MHEIDEEHIKELQDSLANNEQQTYNHDALQMQDDIVRNMNDETKEIIASFENLAQSDTDDDSTTYQRYHEVTDEFYSQLPR